MMVLDRFRKQVVPVLETASKQIWNWEASPFLFVPCPTDHVDVMGGAIDRTQGPEEEEMTKKG